MEIEFWPEDPLHSGVIKDLNKLLTKKKQEWYLDKLEKYEQYPSTKLYSSEIFKRIQNWPLQEIRIKSIRFLGDVLEGKFWLFTVERKQKDKLPQSAFLRASNIRDEFLMRENEN